ncbi:PTS sorbitol transporter subunit IIA [Enterococcus florum]|uniref:PTS sorbitol transporter subunit IIA n=1 Tax=Enterococcus florum TaxID=2480627 RepID=A0A4P5PAL4_9ENTE|nr:PTS glucitol/sorbitol transporter subunit IIA [Enterococcus florum]GCF95145.1 PTS sorbitol transporter subunit IIA [Enterococcus florum]
MAKTKIIQVGKEAINDEPILILFGKTATPELAKYSIIQEKIDDQEIQLAVGSEIHFGEQVYRVTSIGEAANQNLNAIEHASLLFKKNEDKIANGIYLSPEEMPRIEVGMEISFL